VHVLQRGGRLGSSERGPVRAACSPVTSHPHLDHLGCPRGMVLVSRGDRAEAGRAPHPPVQAGGAGLVGRDRRDRLPGPAPSPLESDRLFPRGPHRERPRPNGASSFPQGPGAGIGEGLARLGDQAPFVARRTSVSSRTPNVSEFRTRLFGAGVAPKGYKLLPPEPTTNWRMPFDGSAFPAGVWGANPERTTRSRARPRRRIIPRGRPAPVSRGDAHVGPMGNHSGRQRSLRSWPSIIAALERSPRGGAERTIPRLAYPWAWRNDRLYGTSGRPAAGSRGPEPLRVAAGGIG
jgi:hypothetical protein